MIEFHDIILITEIQLQSKIAQRAADRLRATHDNFDNVETWCSIQSILVAAGNISKILWPNEKYKTRGERLRQWLKVEKDNPLSSRKFRNHFEHYDERVEEWFKNKSSGVYVDLAVNPAFRSEIFDSPRSNAHRGYNSFNNSVEFRNDTLYLDELLMAISDLLNNCESEGFMGYF